MLTSEGLSAAAHSVAVVLSRQLEQMGYKLDTPPFESGNVEGGWIIEGENADGVTINVEVIAGPEPDA